MENTKLCTLRTRVTPNIEEKFLALAKSKGLNTSEFLRYLIMNELQKIIQK